MGSHIDINEQTDKLFKELFRTHFEDNLTYEEMGNQIGKSKDYVYCLFKAYKKKMGIDHNLTKYDYMCYSGKINEIINKYSMGMSTDKIGKEYGVTGNTIASWLRKAEITVRPNGVSSKIDQTLFENIDSEIKAYTLGLIMSDGNISNKGNTISITLTQDDKYILEMINEQLLSGLGNIVIFHKEEKKPRFILQFNGKKLKKDLAKYGIVPAKSHILTKLPQNIPTNLYHHFIRGLYDGDGVCSYYTSHKNQKVRIGFCGANKEFVEDYQNFLVNKINMRKNKLFNTGGCWQCSWGSKENLQSFFDYIYQDASIFLGRKYKKLKDFLDN